MHTAGKLVCNYPPLRIQYTNYSVYKSSDPPHLKYKLKHTHTHTTHTHTHLLVELAEVNKVTENNVPLLCVVVFHKCDFVYPEVVKPQTRHYKRCEQHYEHKLTVCVCGGGGGGIAVCQYM